MDKMKKIPSMPPATIIAPRIETADQLPSEEGNTSVTARIMPVTQGKTKTEFFDHPPTETKFPVHKFSANKAIHSKRADQLTWLLFIGALVVLAVVILGVFLNSKKYSLKKGAVRNSEEAVVDFYQGNSYYFQKVEEERAAKALILHNKGTTEENRSDQMEVTIEDQMSSMDQKLEQMRVKKLMGEAPRPPNDMGPITGIPTQVKPTKIENFNAPADLKRIIPQSLQTNN